ncbi:universal stress protein [Nocardioides sp. URHA0032]|uniref:universal stress protein n=1 Tax=Nocardioides sp. URHA0032 TaxID=1380388 RepID=UPI0004901B32|nr:universal stress protein [Nocardioides sp. URHA0032]
MSRYVRTSGHRSGPIVVAVDRHDGDWSPLEWAASEAAARGRHLRIVCTVGSHPLMFDPYGVIAAQQWDASARRTGELVLQEATRRACDIDPHLPISTRLHVGFADAAILREGQNAEMIVIGRGRDMGRLLAHSRSLSLRVARHANSSVVVVGPANRSRLLAPSRVVLGLDDSGARAAALSCAFLAAHHADVPLDVLQRRPVPEVQDQMEMWRDSGRLKAWAVWIDIAGLKEPICQAWLPSPSCARPRVTSTSGTTAPWR